MTDENTQEIEQDTVAPEVVETAEPQPEGATEDAGVPQPPVLIVPTIGRMVWYNPSESEVALRGFAKLSDQPFSAQVVHVHNDYTVSLSVYDHNGTRFAATNVYLKPSPESEATAPHATWMTYQLTTAKAAA